MDIVVLVKMVPDTESRLEIVDGKLNESGFKYMVNPYDEFAVEQAVQFKEAVGGKVTIVSLFSSDASIDTDLRKMMAIGADEAVVLRQDGYRGDRPSSNAKTLSNAIKEMEADLVIDVPDSATAAAVGYANKSGIPYVSGLVKNRYVGRTFISPD